MAGNPVKGEVPLVLSDGREFTVVLDMEALVEAETRYGKPLPKLMQDAGEGFMGATAALLQGALSQHHDIGRADALDMLRTDADAVAQALSKAGEVAFPSGKAGNEPAPGRRGKTSGRSGAKRG